MNKISNCEGKSCAVEKVASIIGKKWTILIIRDLLVEPKRFNELLDSLEGICPRTLSARLSELSKNKLITKKIISKNPIVSEYSLTEQGHSLSTIISQMRRWGEEYGN